MDRDLARQLSRIEGKINIVARGVKYLMVGGTGFAVYFIVSVGRLAPYIESQLAVYVGLVAAILSGIYIELKMRKLEKLLPYDRD